MYISFDKAWLIFDKDPLMVLNIMIHTLYNNNNNNNIKANANAYMLES